jgi:hypothetical protein
VGWLGGKGSKHNSYGREGKSKMFFLLFLFKLLGRYLTSSYSYNRGLGFLL